jgi:AcrR family transcriptional regulator
MSVDGLSPRKAPRQRRSHQTVDRIVESAARVFDEAGYPSTTTNEIAAEAGISIGSLYQYFPNKDAILVEIARRHVSSSLTALDELFKCFGTDMPLDQLIASVIKVLIDQHEHDRLHLLIAHRAPRSPELDQELERAQQYLVAVTERLLEQHLSTGRDRLLAAQLVVAVLHAAIHDVILRHPRGPQRDAAIELTTSTIIAIARN